MSEIRQGIEHYSGPYDLYEQYIAEGVAIDELLVADWFTEEEYEDVRDYVGELETAYGKPMMGMRVTLRGEYGVHKEDEDGDELLFFDGTSSEAYGEYKGLYVFPMMHEVDGATYIQTRVVHRIVHEPEEYFDHFGDKHSVTKSTYFLVQGTSLETNSVKDVHSFSYLSGEENWLAGSAAEKIDMIISSDDALSVQTDQLLAYLKTNFADIMRDSALRRNIFSYVNSLGMFEHIDLLSSVFIYESNNEHHARFQKSNTYHLKRPCAITARPAIEVRGDQVVETEDLDIFFVLQHDELGQVLIPTSPRYTIVMDTED